MQVQSLGQEAPLEEGLATHSSILAWRMLWTEETGQRTGYSPWAHKELDMTEDTYKLLCTVNFGLFLCFI